MFSWISILFHFFFHFPTVFETSLAAEDFLDQMLAKSPLASEMPGGALTCFDVDSTLRAGFPVLAAAVVISTVTGQVMLAKCGQALCGPSCTGFGWREGSGGDVARSWGWLMAFR